MSKENWDDVPEITEEELERIEEENVELEKVLGFPNRFHYADKSKLRMDRRRGRLYANWQRQATAACTFRSNVYIKVNEIVSSRDLTGVCARDPAKVIVEVESTGFIHV